MQGRTRVVRAQRRFWFSNRHGCTPWPPAVRQPAGCFDSKQTDGDGALAPPGPLRLPGFLTFRAFVPPVPLSPFPP